jgi:hypothetical protein
VDRATVVRATVDLAAVDLAAVDLAAVDLAAVDLAAVEGRTRKGARGQDKKSKNLHLPRIAHSLQSDRPRAKTKSCYIIW